MARFKERGTTVSKKEPKTSMFSLADRHRSMLRTMDTKHEVQLPKKRKTLEYLKKQLQTSSPRDRSKLLLDIKHLQQEIERLENHSELTDYFLDRSIDLYKYYHDPDFQQSDRASTFENYLRRDNMHLRRLESPSIHYCRTCEKPMMLLPCESAMACPSCGISEKVIVNNERPTQQDAPIDTGRSQFTYSRMHHFRELLSQAQGKESTNISSDVFELIQQEVKKQRLEPYQLNKEIIKDILKKLNMRNKYEHISHILNKLNPACILNFDEKTEEKMCYMFECIQEPYIENCKLFYNS